MANLLTTPKLQDLNNFVYVLFELLSQRNSFKWELNNTAINNTHTIVACHSLDMFQRLFQI